MCVSDNFARLALVFCVNTSSLCKPFVLSIFIFKTFTTDEQSLTLLKYLVSTKNNQINKTIIL